MAHHENYTLCECGGVSLYDIEDALFSAAEIRDIDDAFRIVQEKTHCANLCGKCRTAILELIAELMYNEIYGEQNKKSGAVHRTFFTCICRMGSLPLSHRLSRS